MWQAPFVHVGLPGPVFPLANVRSLLYPNQIPAPMRHIAHTMMLRVFETGDVFLALPSTIVADCVLLHVFCLFPKMARGFKDLSLVL